MHHNMRVGLGYWHYHEVEAAQNTAFHGTAGQ